MLAGAAPYWMIGTSNHLQLKPPKGTDERHSGAASTGTFRYAGLASGKTASSPPSRSRIRTSSASTGAGRAKKRCIQ